METRKQETWLGTRLSFPQSTDEPLDAVAFIETSTGDLRHLDLIPASSDQLEFSQCLWRAIQTPSSQKVPYRPGSLVVDSPELLKAARSTAGMQQIALQCDPKIAEMLREPLNKLMASMEDLGFHYTFDDDVDTDLVGEFFERVYQYLETENRKEFLNRVLFIEGLEISPLFCITIELDGLEGLALCLNEAAVDSFLDCGDEELTDPCLAFLLDPSPGPAFSEEIETYNWRVHPLGAPPLMRHDREERPHPTNQEIQLCSEALEALLLFLSSDEAELEAPLSNGREVRVGLAEAFPADDEVAIPVSLTLGQRKLIAELRPGLCDILNLDRKSRCEVLIPLSEFELIPQLLQKNIMGLKGAQVRAASGVARALSEAADQFQYLHEEAYDSSPDMSQDEFLGFLELMMEGFARSPEFKALPEKEPSISIFFEFAFNLDEVLPQGVSRAECMTVLLGMFPAKVCLSPDEGRDFLTELEAFFRYGQRELEFPFAEECLETISDPGFVANFVESLSNPDLFGSAKTLVHFAGESGFDVTTDEGVRQAMEAWNAQLNPIAPFPEQTTSPGQNSNKRKKKNKRKMGKKSRKKNRRR